MINYTINCQSNQWPARIKKINLILENILKYKNELHFKKKINYNCSLILINDKLMKKINLKFKKKNITTDVLTFVSEINVKNKKKLKICDIYLSAEIVTKDANENKVEFYNHLTHLIIHSFLHINGFVHKKINEFNKMKKIEIMVLKKIGIANPY